ncbi:MAG TPA: hypothetical protein VJO16_01590 [Candidatus Acidoferrum sp.]|nr:hypothetical protein [Candidatus Acidoferrum sp.]
MAVFTPVLFYHAQFAVSHLALARRTTETYYSLGMTLTPIKTASETGYCDCICGCYELASLRDEDTGKGYCPACGKDHLDLNTGAGIPQPAPVKVSPNSPGARESATMPAPADPPGRLR